MKDPEEKSRLYIYDFDDTLVNTNEVLEENGWLDQAEELCFNDSVLGQKVADLSKPYEKIWKQVEGTAKLGTNMILSGRNAMQIAYWLKENDKGHLFKVLVGLGTRENVAEEKKKMLKKCVDEEYDEIFFYDDKMENIQVARSVPGINAIHVTH